MTLKDSTADTSEMLLEFMSSLPEILEGNDPHDEIYKQAHAEDE